MKSNNRKLVSFLLTLIIVLSSVTPAFAGADTRGKKLYNELLSYNKGSNSVQAWIDTTLTSNAGLGSEWYIIALSQNEKISNQKYSYKKYESALIKYVNANKNINPVEMQRIALALISIGSTNSFISTTADKTIGKGNIMSYIFGLHILNNGYKSTIATKSSVTSYLLQKQTNEGGWALFGGNDVDVTAMTIQALAPQYTTNSKVKSAINKALGYLSSVQNGNGTFSAINGNKKVPTSESTVQVLMALACLNIDATRDNRFIKNGNSIFDAIDLFKSGGGIAHIVNGSANALSTQQAFYCLVSYNRMNSLFILDKARPNDVEYAKEITTNTSSDTQASNGATSHSNSDNSNKVVGSSINNSSNSNTDNKHENTNSNVNNSSSTTKLSNEISSNQDISNDNSQVSNTENNAQSNSSNNDNQINQKDHKSSYKIWVSLGILAIGIITFVILFKTKKANKGNLIITAFVCAIAIIVVIFTNFQSVDDHDNIAIKKDNAIGTVTITISCDTIKSEKDNKFIPPDGIILSTTSVEISEGETVYEVLNEVCTKYDIAIETKGSTQSIYVEGINQIYELDYGDLSGWMYHINGQEPSISCGSYELKDGDKIEWAYTKDLGRDIA